MKPPSDVLEIRPYGGESQAELAPLLREYSYGRYCSDRSLNLEASRRLELDQLHSYLNQEPTAAWIAVQGGVIVGVLGLRKSKWDTDFWGVKYGNLDHLVVRGTGAASPEGVAGKLAQTADAWAKQERMDFMAARVDVFDLPVAHVLQNHGFRYIETTIINSFDLKRLDRAPSGEYLMRLARPDEVDLLMDMATDGFLTHRFYADKRFPKPKVDEMYRRWVQTSLTNTAVWSTVVLEADGRARGFMTYRVEDLTPYFGMKFVKWRMAALGKEERGKGHGVNLFVGAMRFVQDEAGVVDSGLTIRNIHSFNLHTKVNFRLICSSLTLHKWYKTDAESDE